MQRVTGTRLPGRAQARSGLVREVPPAVRSAGPEADRAGVVRARASTGRPLHQAHRRGLAASGPGRGARRDPARHGSHGRDAGRRRGRVAAVLRARPGGHRRRAAPLPRVSDDLDAYSPEEVWALVRAAGSEQDAALFLTAAFTGLRMGELLAPQWRDVDFAGEAIRVRHSYNIHGSLGTPKSGKVRSVPLVPAVAQALAGSVSALISSPRTSWCSRTSLGVSWTPARSGIATARTGVAVKQRQQRWRIESARVLHMPSRRCLTDRRPSALPRPTGTCRYRGVARERSVGRCGAPSVECRF